MINDLNEIFFKDLWERRLDYFLNVDTSSLGKVLGNVLISSEEILVNENPDAVLILGDNYSSIAGIIAKRLKIPIFHLEAGNRCYDLNLPGEINRSIIGHIAVFILVYTEHARRHLVSKRLHHRRIYVTASPMKDVLLRHRNSIDTSKVLKGLNLEKDKYFIVSIHREENVDFPNHLNLFVEALEKIASKHKLPAIVSTHPRTRKCLESLQSYQPSSLIRFLKPFGFFDYVHLQKKAKCMISKSGNIAEESAILSFPVITVITTMERPEALVNGTVMITGLDPDVILRSIDLQISDHIKLSKQHIPWEYDVVDTSKGWLN